MGTVIAIVLTANHFVLDALGGWIILALGYLLARTFTRAGRGEPNAPADAGSDGAAAPADAG